MLFERVVGMERLVGVKQSLRLDGKKVCNIKTVGILQAESNNIKACALPSIHLPLTRWCKARDSAVLVGLVRGEGLLSFYNGCEKGYIRCDDPTLFEGNWYGQLMTSPQIFAYLLQIEYWLRRYDVRLDRQ